MQRKVASNKPTASRAKKPQKMDEFSGELYNANENTDLPSQKPKRLKKAKKVGDEKFEDTFGGISTTTVFQEQTQYPLPRDFSNGDSNVETGYDT